MKSSKLDDTINNIVAYFPKISLDELKKGNPIRYKSNGVRVKLGSDEAKDLYVAGVVVYTLAKDGSISFDNLDKEEVEKHYAIIGSENHQLTDGRFVNTKSAVVYHIDALDYIDFTETKKP